MNSVGEKERENRLSRAKILKCENAKYFFIDYKIRFLFILAARKKTELFFLFILAFPLSYPFRISQLENVKS